MSTIVLAHGVLGFGDEFPDCFNCFQPFITSTVLPTICADRDMSQASLGQATNAILLRDPVNPIASFHRPNGSIIHALH